MHMQQVKARSLFLNYSTFDLVRTKMHLYRELRGLVVHALYVEFEESASLNARGGGLPYESDGDARRLA